MASESQESQAGPPVGESTSPSPDPGRQPLASATTRDDGEIPDKQIQRWNNEGGSWLPHD